MKGNIKIINFFLTSCFRFVVEKLELNNKFTHYSFVFIFWNNKIYIDNPISSHISGVTLSGIASVCPNKNQNFHKNKFMLNKTMLPLQSLCFYWPSLQQKYLMSSKMFKIADLTCNIMRKFLFPTYSSLYLNL